MGYERDFRFKARLFLVIFGGVVGLFCLGFLIHIIRHLASVAVSVFWG